MAFWLDQDDDDPFFGAESSGFSQTSAARLSQGTCFSQVTIGAGAAGAAFGENTNGLVCDQCGGTDFYVDETTNRNVCTSCYTESQPTQTEMDYEEVVNLAAKTKTGALKLNKTRPPRRSDGPHWRKKQDLSELDNSMCLPDIKACISGFQTVLWKCVERLARLMKLSTEETDAVHKTVKTLWMNYLRAWSDGAQYYGTVYREIRFCLRDTFIHDHHVAMIRKELAYRVIQKIKESKMKNGGKEEGKKSKKLIDSDKPRDAQPAKTKTRKKTTGKKSAGNSTKRADRADQKWKVANFESSEDEGDSESSSDEEEEGSNKPYSVRLDSPHVQLVKKHTMGKERTYMDAALEINPSMTMAAALLFLAVYQAGVTSSQMCFWISSGSIPLLNSFPLLTRSQQRSLILIRHFFLNRKVCTPLFLETQAMQLAVACRLKNKPYFLYKYEMYTKKEIPRFVTGINAPRIAAQFVADLGLGQDVLDRALALMGVASSRTSGFVVKPLPSASPEKLGFAEDILALLAISCFLDPEWRQWMFVRPSAEHKLRLSDKSRIIPMNNEQFQLLGNGKEMEAYVDYLERFIFTQHSTAAPEFTKLLEQAEDRYANNTNAANDAVKAGSDDGDRLNETNLEQIRPYSCLAGAPPETVNEPSRHPWDSSSNVAHLAAKSRSRYELDSQQRLFIEFLAQGTRYEAFKIQASFNRLLERPLFRIPNQYG